jgi:hypothetical protein
MRVRVNSIYVYNPVPLDLIDGKVSCNKGDKVRVINLPGAPKANTMNHCYIESLEGTFLGMVCCNSLEKPE